MDERINVTQKGSLGGETTQIGIQNNYTGMTPAEACSLATNLFIENFPKLQKQAMETAKKRVDEFVSEVMKKIEKERIDDLSPFADPDVQYVLYETQKNYARLGTDDMLGMLSSIIVERIRNNDDFSIKVIIDKALETVNMLTPAQLDTLTIILLTKESHPRLGSVEQLGRLLNYWNIKYNGVDYRHTMYLDSIGCLRIALGNSYQLLAKHMGLKEDEVRAVCPPRIAEIHGDYGLSLVGRLLAIMNRQIKEGVQYNIKSWLR